MVPQCTTRQVALLGLEIDLQIGLWTTASHWGKSWVGLVQGEVMQSWDSAVGHSHQRVERELGGLLPSCWKRIILLYICIYIFSCCVFPCFWVCSLYPNKDVLVCKQTRSTGKWGNFCLLRANREGLFHFPRFLGGVLSQFIYLWRGTLDTLNPLYLLAEGLHNTFIISLLFWSLSALYKDTASCCKELSHLGTVVTETQHMVSNWFSCKLWK